MKLTVALIGVLTIIAHSQQNAPASPSGPRCEMLKRGDQAMGFSHEKTTHHFLLFKDGGAIEVQANDPSDKRSRDEIRTHHSHIAEMFAESDLDIPMFIHGETPPGAPTMKRLHGQITYKIKDTKAGASLRIRTEDGEAFKSIHQFLRFQIADHKTGDHTDITNDRAGR
jgi:hypothetical protein